MALEGSIQDFGLPDIIQFLRHQNKTGVLTIETKNSWTKVIFEGGMIVSTETPETEGGDWIGKRLVQSERMTETQLKEVLKQQQKSKEKIETVIVNAGLISKQDLAHLLDLQTKETLFALFRLKEGRYSFETIAVSYNQDYVTPMDAEFILLEGMRQYDEWPIIENKINTKNIIFGKKQELSDKVKISGKVEQALDQELGKEESSSGDFIITDDEMAVYSRVDGRRDVQKIIDMAQMGEFSTCKALINLLSLGLIVKREELPALPKPSIAQTVPRAVPALPHPTKIWNILLIPLFGLWVLVSGPKMVEGLVSPLKVGLFFEQELIEQKKTELEEAALVYYLRTSKLPDSLDELAADLKDVASLVEELGRRGVRYNIVEGGFTIETKP